MLQLNFTLYGKANIALDEARVSNDFDILGYIYIWSRHLKLQKCFLVETTTWTLL